MATRFKYKSEGKSTFKAGVERWFKSVQKSYETYEDSILFDLNDRILALTPVWSGDALVNWRWSVDTPALLHVDPIPVPKVKGHTNKMPLGSEPRRSANEALERASFLSVLKAVPTSDIWLTNNSPHIVELEYGLLPTPETSRVHGSQGIIRLAIKEVFGQLH